MRKVVAQTFLSGSSRLVNGLVALVCRPRGKAVVS